MDHVLRCHEMVRSDIVRGRGCLVYDVADRAYVDFEAGVWCANLGHGHPKVLKAIQTQSEELMHIGYRYTNRLAERASVAVLSTLGWAEGRCLFLSSGSEAVEFAVAAARRRADRPRLLTFAGAYLSAYGSAGAQLPEAWHRFDGTECETCAHGVECDRDCDRLRTIPFERIDGFVFDSGNMHGTAHFPPLGPVRQIAARVREDGGVVVANEVTTGMGRTGRWAGFEHYGLRPDLVAFGKGLGNGYPVSAVALTPAVAGPIEASEYRYVQSHQNDPLACAVACEVIASLRDEGLIERADRVGAHFLDRLEGLADSTDAVREVRGRGLMLAADLDAQIVSAASIYERLFRRGFIVGRLDDLNLLRFYPPLTIALDEIDAMMDALSDALEEEVK